MNFFTFNKFSRGSKSSKGIWSFKKGFTLIELLVSISIFVAMTALVLFKYDSFNGTVLLTNLAYDIALSVRQAQVYGLNVREVTPGGGQFGAAYGVYFDTHNNSQFIFFADTDASNAYSGGEGLETYGIKKGNTISAICATNAGAGNCASSPVSRLDVLFRRPDPVAIITSGGGTTFAYAKITIKAPDGTTQDIVIQSTGEISVP